MVKQIKYQFFFQDAANATFRELEIKARYVRQQVPTYDFHDREFADVQDIFETISIEQIHDVTLGIELNLIDLPAELRRCIVMAGLRAANETYKNDDKREGIRIALGNLV